MTLTAPEGSLKPAHSLERTTDPIVCSLEATPGIAQLVVGMKNSRRVSRDDRGKMANVELADFLGGIFFSLRGGRKCGRKSQVKRPHGQTLTARLPHHHFRPMPHANLKSVPLEIDLKISKKVQPNPTVGCFPNSKSLWPKMKGGDPIEDIICVVKMPEAAAVRPDHAPWTDP